GELRTIRWSNAALVDAERRRTHVIGIGIDITDQQRAEQARERLAAIGRSMFELMSPEERAASPASRATSPSASISNRS
ncbi:MAG TPA: hypothetical protein VMU39_09085, partial [Solirubrobacteraceae bacterium]|nr:hypothetical protein [Solirubrobacteraceae bacterium]